MAAFDVTKKAEIYHILYRLNSAFATIVGCYQNLQETGIMNAKSARLHQGLAQEAQSEFNHEFLSTLQSIEMKDWNRFGKIRQAMEKHLRDPDDALLQADARPTRSRKTTTKTNTKTVRFKKSMRNALRAK